ncbi:hypothetical protein YC2023_081270 [Brassica napus]
MQDRFDDKNQNRLVTVRRRNECCQIRNLTVRRDGMHVLSNAINNTKRKTFSPKSLRNLVSGSSWLGLLALAVEKQRIKGFIQEEETLNKIQVMKRDYDETKMKELE